MEKNNRLLVVDDSHMMRQVISNLFNSDPHIEVIATANSGQQALELIQAKRPDVITLDINMPEMDGITALKHLMIQTPTPTVMLSSLSRDGAKITFDALRYGAVDFITKPSHLKPEAMQQQSEAMIRTVKAAAGVEMDVMHYIRSESVPSTAPEHEDYQYVVAIGAAAGGYNSLLTILPKLSANTPLVYLVVLYGASRYIDAFISYLNQHCAITVKRAVDGEKLAGATCYVATGEEYMTLHHQDEHDVLRMHPAPFSSQNSAINRLMFSLADVVENRGIGMVLSGDSNDGSEGLEELGRVGGKVMVQNPNNCLYKEMSESVLNTCHVNDVLSASEIATHLNAYAIES